MSISHTESAATVVHDPRGYPPRVTGKGLASRLESLDDRKVFLVDCLFDNSAVFMDELQKWFVENMPRTRTEIITPREAWADDPEMRARIAAEGEAAILGVGL